MLSAKKQGRYGLTMQKRRNCRVVVSAENQLPGAGYCNYSITFSTLYERKGVIDSMGSGGNSGKGGM